MLEAKKLVGKYAASYVEDGMVVGLGTGSTAHWFIEEVGRRYQAGELPNIKLFRLLKLPANKPVN